MKYICTRTTTTLEMVEIDAESHEHALERIMCIKWPEGKKKTSTATEIVAIDGNDSE